MAEQIRYSELATQFRMRLSEPTEGTFGHVYYDSLMGNVDELRLILNTAQRYFTFVCYSSNYTLIQDTAYLAVLSDATRYSLPELFLGPVSVFHRTYNNEYPVEQDNIDQVRAYRGRFYTNYRYECYDISEKVPLVVATGVVATEHATQIVVADASGVRVGDTCYNLTDNSQATVSVVAPAVNTVTVDLLVNGNANIFQKGDTYQIDTREAVRDAMDVYPRVTRADTESGYSGMAANWEVQEDAPLHSICVTVSGIPSNLEDDERLILELLSGEDVVATSGKEGLDSGQNVFEFLSRHQLREGTMYTVRLTRVDTETTIDVDSIDVTVSSQPESIIVKYARYPKPMEKDSDYCEMPLYAHEGMYAHAHVLAQQKKSGNPNPDPGLVNNFAMKKKEVADFLFKRDERGPHQMSAALSGSRAGGSPFPGNYSRALIDPSDLL